MAQYAQYGLAMADNAPKDGILPGWLDPWPSPFHKAVELSGYGGIGIDWPHLISLFYTSIPIFVVVMIVSLVLKKQIYPRLGIALGISRTNKKKQRKFANQLWLFSFYAGNAIFGYYVQYDKPWFSVPQTLDHVREFFTGFPDEPYPLMIFYYSLSFAFYASELVSLFIETKRSDFWEYVVHHIVTIILFVMTYAAREHNMGVYVIFLHDASDIFLCLAKCCHYVNFQAGVNVGVGLFMAGFVLFRFMCLPVVITACFYISPVIRKAAVNFYVLAHLLLFVIQLLHVFWFYLILRMVIRLVRGVKGDARSDTDNDTADKKKKQIKSESTSKPSSPKNE
ncbi:transmembrane protein, putative [Bodo saltans]|uniref:Transmembrane protein, putative n=1 Tax=Bodo saltans TaxID=75058 RepID=A0A0S4JEY3_BODSA|nr:transmembrane protein, putative [Bodo saltans]|eukprot:CUG89946.1 transmembrane protein, putative [Bodo saltans]